MKDVLKKSLYGIVVSLVVVLVVTALHTYKSIASTPSEVKIVIREKKDKFCFVGDVFFSTNIRKSYDEKGISGILDASFSEILSNTDMNIANLECSITDEKDNRADKTYTFALPSKYVKGLKKLNIDLFTLANNHILDFGMGALDNTIKALDSIDIGHMGAGDTLSAAKRVYVKKIDGKRYGFLGASAVLPSGKWQANELHGGVFNGYDIESVVREIESIKPYVDKVIVYMHWGNELENESNKTQRFLGHKLVDAGADLVIGTHAHTTQEIEYYKGVPIVYSLGNFIYGGQSRDMIIVEASFDYSKDVDGELRLRIFPGVSGYKSTRRYDTDSIMKNKLKSLNAKSKTCYIDEDGYVYAKEKEK